MNKTELIAAVAEKTGLSKKDTEAAVNATLLTITETLKAEEKVQLVGFGSFETKKRAARTGLNPRTKETVEIPAAKVPTFKAGKALHRMRERPVLCQFVRLRRGLAVHGGRRVLAHVLRDAQHLHRQGVLAEADGDDIAHLHIVGCALHPAVDGDGVKTLWEGALFYA